jgi:hypothetical protein
MACAASTSVIALNRCASSTARLPLACALRKRSARIGRTSVTLTLAREAGASATRRGALASVVCSLVYSRTVPVMASAGTRSEFEKVRQHTVFPSH